MIFFATLKETFPKNFSCPGIVSNMKNNNFLKAQIQKPIKSAAQQFAEGKVCLERTREGKTIFAFFSSPHESSVCV